jgi:hypothetical protein
MSATQHNLWATRHSVVRGVDYEEHYLITFRYVSEQPLRFYKRNGDPADPPDPEMIDLVSVIDEAGQECGDMDEWAAEWLANHSDAAREKALNDLEIQGAPV